jgi:hypothetical protein
MLFSVFWLFPYNSLLNKVAKEETMPGITAGLRNHRFRNCGLDILHSISLIEV